MNRLTKKVKGNFQLIGFLTWFSLPFFLPVIRIHGDHNCYEILQRYNDKLFLSIFILIPISFILATFIKVFQIKKIGLSIFILILLDLIYLFYLTQVIYWGTALIGMYLWGFNTILANILVIHTIWKDRKSIELDIP